MSGQVYLVGSGPGDPELLTLKALRILRTADIVLHDELVSPEILQLVPATACVHNVGKRCGAKIIRQPEINEFMVRYARAGYTVVRLKGGDPMIFGRAGEEMAALRAANINFEVVPGVTAALGAAAAAQISLTERHVAAAVALVTYSRAEGTGAMRWRSLIESGATLALYMPGDDYSKVSSDLREAGLGQNTPCAVISCASTPAEQVRATTLGRLAETQCLPSPALIVVGLVAGTAIEQTARVAESMAGFGERPALETQPRP